MPEPTLYRIAKVDEPGNDTIWAQRGDDYLGVLVPVEPDYEAATAKLIEQGPSNFSDESVAHNIIHAAFKGAGIGDNDE